MNLREARKEAGYTQKQLSELLGISQQSYSDYENERTFPDKDTLLKLAGCLNVSTDYLLGRTDELGAVVMPGAMQLSDSERELLLRYRQLRPDLQELLLSTAKTWTDAPASERHKKV